jgi:AmmeMemoRadiSam system protein B
VILFGTDHRSGNAVLTLTVQSYATPWGTLPTDTKVVDKLAEALGAEAAFASELHHRSEHSVELAAVWLHFVRGGEPVPVLPILCGSFADFIEGDVDPEEHGPFGALLAVLDETVRARQTLVVAAADLAHMGPAFGDPYGLDMIARGQLRRADETLLAAVHGGDAAGFYGQLQAERDRRHVCGLPPMYLTLRLLEGVSGETLGYDVCPADPQGLSYVSIAGVILR